MTTKLNNFYRGDTVSFGMTIKLEGSPVDITGDTFTLTLKLNETDSDPGAVQKDAVLTDPTNGELTFTLTDSDTDIPIGQYHYDIQWTTSAGSIKTLMKGVLSVLQDITLT